MTFLTFKYRVKDSSVSNKLRAFAVASNQVWNFCAATQKECDRRRGGNRTINWPSAFDLDALTRGCGRDLGIHSDTITQICRQFSRARNSIKKCPKYRISFGSNRSLGWVPFRDKSIQLSDGAVTYLGIKLPFWLSREIDGVVRSGAFVEDARGRWYVTFQCEVVDYSGSSEGIVGIDLGLKDLATLSNGENIPALKQYRKYESKLGIAQRAGNKKRARAINAKITNTRRHHLHEQSTRIVRENNLIVVGNVNAAALKRTRMAKSVSDAGWSMFRHMLRYKSARRQAVYVETDERYSSQTCSCCGIIPDSSPKGKGALGIRHWQCSECGTFHDRDVNAARNILRAGLECQPPAEGIIINDEALKERPLCPETYGGCHGS